MAMSLGPEGIGFPYFSPTVCKLCGVAPKDIDSDYSVRDMVRKVC